METYARLKKFIFVFLLVYFVAGLSTHVLPEGREKDWLPFFSWFLFSWTPTNEVRQYAVRILEFRGKRLEPPVFFDQAYGIIDDPRSPKPRELIRRLGGSLIMKRDEESEWLRTLLEEIYLPATVRYEVDIVTYQPLVRFRSGASQAIQPLAEFTKP